MVTPTAIAQDQNDLVFWRTSTEDGQPGRRHLQRGKTATPDGNIILRMTPEASLATRWKSSANHRIIAGTEKRYHRAASKLLNTRATR